MDEYKNSMQVSEKLLRATEVAEILNISPAMAYRLMQVGDIPTVQIGTARRVQPTDLQTFIANNLTPGK
jgi:excisionase family DNA binding protein